MRSRAVYLALGLTLFALMAPSGGGLPSRPRFQAVGVGVAAPAAGNLAVSGTISGNGSALTNLNASAVTAGTLADARLSGNVALLGGSIFSGSVSVPSAFVVRSVTAFPALNSYVSFQDGGGERGWVGYGEGSADMRLRNAANGNLKLETSGAGIVLVNGSQVCTASGAGCPAAASEIRCTAACSAASLAVGQSLIVIRATDATKASDATYADDAVLQILNMPAGDYRYEAETRLDGGTGSGGSKSQLNFTGLGTDVATAHGSRLCPSSPGTIIAAFTTVGASADCAVTGYSGLSVRGTFRTTAGTEDLTVQWAQSASNASAATLRARSYIRIQRLT